MRRPIPLLWRVAGGLMMGLGSLAWQATPAVDRVSFLASLTAAERAFASTASEIGVRDGFLTFLAENAVSLQPPVGDGGARLISARARFVTSPSPPYPLASTLVWAPYTGQVSADGTMGWLTGPYVNRTAPSGKVLAQGAYFSVWRRQPDGTWKVWLDQGVASPEPWADAGAFRPALEPFPGAATEAIGDVEDQLRVSRSAWASRLATSVRVHRDGRPPIVGADAATRWHSEAWTTLNESVVATEVAASGDMAVVLGGYSATSRIGPERGIFARVWQRGPGGQWVIVFETSKPG